MRLAISLWVVACAFAIVPRLAAAQDFASESQSAVRACYEGAGSLSAAYDCMGGTVTMCLGRTGLSADESVLPCVSAELSAWRELLDGENALVAETIRASAGGDDPCEPSIDQCLEQLTQMTAAAADAMERQCEVESQPQNSAGHPELALALCQLRETARNTVRMRALKEKIRQ